LPPKCDVKSRRRRYRNFRFSPRARFAEGRRGDIFAENLGRNFKAKFAERVGQVEIGQSHEAAAQLTAKNEEAAAARGDPFDYALASVQIAAVVLRCGDATQRIDADQKRGFGK